MNEIVKRIEGQAESLYDRLRFLQEAFNGLTAIEASDFDEKSLDLNIVFHCGAAAIIGDIAAKAHTLMETIDEIRQAKAKGQDKAGEEGRS